MWRHFDDRRHDFNYDVYGLQCTCHDRLSQCLFSVLCDVNILRLRNMKVFSSSRASAHISQPTKATWETIEMAINRLIESSSAPRWPRELWVCNLCFPSEISQWSAADWYRGKSSAGRNRLTKQGQSSPSVLREKATTATTLFLVCRVLTVGTDAILLPRSLFLLQLGKACYINIIRGSTAKTIGFVCFMARGSSEEFKGETVGHFLKKNVEAVVL